MLYTRLIEPKCDDISFDLTRAGHFRYVKSLFVCYPKFCHQVCQQKWNWHYLRADRMSDTETNIANISISILTD